MRREDGDQASGALPGALHVLNEAARLEVEVLKREGVSGLLE
jgi:hypothetical protein